MKFHQQLMIIHENLIKIFESLMQLYENLLKSNEKLSNVSDFSQTSDTLHHCPFITTYFHIVQHMLTDSQRFPFSVKIGLFGEAPKHCKKSVLERWSRQIKLSKMSAL